MFANTYPYKWHAHLHDGTIINQFDPDGTQHKFTELEAKASELDYLQITGVSHPIVMNIPPGSKPIIFERVRATKDGVNDVTERYHYFGFELLGKKTFLVIHGVTGLISIEYDDTVTRS
jgi:hypothetical protein